MLSAVTKVDFPSKEKKKEKNLTEKWMNVPCIKKGTLLSIPLLINTDLQCCASNTHEKGIDWVILSIITCQLP